ncbi:MAG: polysaccharide pyruvyl transferase family protein [Clostridia bacterium]|nr:polysaccharide pyruvyl transferase family protein [Clostridia bacterium]
MKAIGTLTFHRARNYGSVLQAYALQRFLGKIAHDKGVQIDHKIIDVTPHAQKELYALYKRGVHPKTLVKNAVAFCHRRDLRQKQKKFDGFVRRNLPLTQPCDAVDLPRICNGMDYVICGSDQIWNVRAGDFEPWFYLDFPTKAKKLSYAASMGPLAIDWSRYDRQRVSDCLADFSEISVREQASADHVKALCGRDAHIDVDPTLLLTLDDWRAVQSDASYKDGRYILLYCLEPTPAQLDMAKRISKKLNLPILVTKYNNKHDMLNRFFKRYDCGPEDFLSLIDHAALVLTSSFHGTVFSTLYQKPFYVFDGASDHRISHFLSCTDLSGQALPTNQGIDGVTLRAPDFSRAQAYLQAARDRAGQYLCRVLDF